ncbi:PTS fructose transporter subunit IIB [Vibrio gazogenes]|uniref:protein-N(pi)-phosphohistidine--D-fructose phosphotransferase n=1 Tax=Vibrio gazogenes DSM 21264 = NBRC 103151 TaxID=1123492 RepID=A0A1M5FHV2_VIBGA|nr:PTS fructose transporter subunit IIB [Vibrio gazogenes]USP14442.1 PTS fructose transporter subunit IIB [Vibrio gazogenes]SHF91068.1 PTS system, fructose-specific IIB component [Vibrio gazogenes DSM 21264] [Vibrio gazogenes DSM 21264 = NBRC 103151]SJN52834.1 PTS system mannose-specific EIIBCA component [Vibrio gazogenes]
MKVVAVTACPTGIAHTYMAAEQLLKAAGHRGVSIKVETQGAMGIENELTVADIVSADIRIIVSDIEIEERSRFKGCQVFHFSIEEVLINAEQVLETCLRKV